MRRVPFGELLDSPGEIQRLKAQLSNGGVAAIPTETFYGFAADPSSETGVRRILSAKGRDEGKPLPVLFAGRNQLAQLGIDPRSAQLDRFFRIWPAALTVVLPISEPLPASRGASTLGVRLPDSARLRSLLSAVGPLTATSVNRSGQAPLDDPDAVAGQFEIDIDILIDGGKTPGRLPSTVLDATREPPVVLRAGAYAWAVPGSPD